MQIYTISEARAKLFTLVDDVQDLHKPIYLKGKRNEAVILSKEDYEGLQETLAIYSVRGLAESILEASNSPKEEFISHEEFWKE